MVRFIIRLLVILVAVVAVQPTNAAPKKNKKEKKEQVETLAPDEIQMVVFGEGVTTDEAVKNALLSAIEQNYGTFVSSNTSFINDEIVKDEIATVSSGNIRSYKILNESINGNTCRVTLEAIVSLGKLASFVQSKGGSAELAGAQFAMNVKIEKAKLENMMMAIEHLKLEVAEMFKNCYDYTIKVSEPAPFRFKNAGSRSMMPDNIMEGASINVKVTATFNKNAYEAIDYAKRTMKAILSAASADKKAKIDEENAYLTVIDPSFVTQMFNFYISDGINKYYPFVELEHHDGPERNYYYSILAWKQGDNVEEIVENISTLQESNINGLCYPIIEYEKSNRVKFRFENYTFEDIIGYSMEEISKVTNISVAPLNGEERPPIFWKVKGFGTNFHAEPTEYYGGIKHDSYD
ncbi:hypothetical protein [Paramuribaculum intestinale]|jgi:hypothetical protein|uniref:hypothetical protein n=1 Tax=Paramuribaculum intestinale TaxID=2094151 RepID=UPI0025B0A87A|nr:hypothetical protein [Paramuribaculum intestinale]